MTQEKLADTVTVLEHNGAVLIGTPERPIAALDPEGARQVAEALARSSYKARFGRDLVPEKQSAVSRTVHDKLVTRAANIIKTMTEQHKPRIYIAQQVVAEVLKGVL